MDTTFQQIAGGRVLVVGDVMLDMYVDPPPCIVDYRPGGAANVAVNIRSLGGVPVLIGVVGDDSPAKPLDLLLMNCGVPINTLVLEPGRKTTSKIRKGRDGAWKMTSHEHRNAIEPSTADRVFAIVGQAMPYCHVVVLSDYGKGVLTKPLTQSIIQLARSSGRIVIVDPWGTDPSKYIGAHVIKPNRLELQHLSGGGIECSPESEVTEAVGKLWDSGLAATSFVVTYGDKGLYTALAGVREFTHYDSVRVKALDECGAGDSALAGLALALAQPLTLSKASQLANFCGAAAVSQHRTAAITPGDVLRVVRMDERQ